MFIRVWGYVILFNSLILLIICSSEFISKLPKSVLVINVSKLIFHAKKITFTESL